MRIFFCFILLIPITFAGPWEDTLSNFDLNTNQQSHCFADQDKLISSAHPNRSQRIASLTKMATSLWALDRLGKDFRFKTNVYISENSIHIAGGSDPYFVYENIFLLISVLNSLNIHEIKTITFDHQFLLNWENDGRAIQKELKEILNTKSWPNYLKIIHQDIIEDLEKSGLDYNLKDLSFSVNNIFIKNSSPSKANVKIAFHSNPLHRILKEMNIYSSNFIADEVFYYLGGETPFNHYLRTKLNLSNSIYLYNGSGLGRNYASCSDIVQIMKNLYKVAKKQTLDPFDILAAPGIDGGTLEDRLSEYNYSFAGKTGTLNGISTLAGMIYTESGMRYFSILNQTWNLNEARRFQDRWVDYLFDSSYGPLSKNYTPRAYHPLENIVIQL